MAVNTSEYILAELFDVKLFDLETGACLATVRRERGKETSWDREGDTTYATANGAKLLGFGANKAEMLSMQSAVITDGLLATQSGSDKIDLTSTTAILYTDDEIVASSDAGLSKYTATGTVGSEIVALHVLNDDGSLGKVLTQVAATPSTDEYTYTSGTKTFDFTAAQFADGQKFVAFYYPTVATAKQFVNRTDVFAKNVKVVADGIFNGVCDGKAYAGQLVFDKAKMSEGWSFSLTESKEPSIVEFSLEALQGCSSPTLSNLYIYDTEDIT